MENISSSNIRDMKLLKLQKERRFRLEQKKYFKIVVKNSPNLGKRNKFTALRSSVATTQNKNEVNHVYS